MCKSGKKLKTVRDCASNRRARARMYVIIECRAGQWETSGLAEPGAYHGFNPFRYKSTCSTFTTLSTLPLDPSSYFSSSIQNPLIQKYIYIYKGENSTTFFPLKTILPPIIFIFIFFFLLFYYKAVSEPLINML